MSRLTKDIPENPADYSFGDLLYCHLGRWGTRPEGTPGRTGDPWTHAEFAKRLGVSERTVRNWVNDEVLPDEVKYIQIALFGEHERWEEERNKLRRLFERAWAARRKEKASPAHEIPAMAANGTTALDAEAKAEAGQNTPDAKPAQSEAPDPLQARPQGAHAAKFGNEVHASPQTSANSGNNTQNQTVSLEFTFNLGASDPARGLSPDEPEAKQGSAGGAVLSPATVPQAPQGKARRIFAYSAIGGSVIAAVTLFATMDRTRPTPAASQPNPAQTELLRGFHPPALPGVPTELPRPDLALGISPAPPVANEGRRTDPDQQKAPASAEAAVPEASAIPPLTRLAPATENSLTTYDTLPEAEARKRALDQKRLNEDLEADRLNRGYQRDRQNQNPLLRKIGFAEDEQQRIRDAYTRDVAGIGFSLRENTSAAGEIDLGWVRAETIQECAKACAAADCSGFSYTHSSDDPLGHGEYCWRYRGPLKLSSSASHTVGVPMKLSLNEASSKQPSVGAATMPGPGAQAQSSSEAAGASTGITRCANGSFQVTGFKLYCDKILGGGTTLGSTQLRYSVSNINECAEKCRPVPKCVAFTYAASDVGKHQCEIFGPTPIMRDSAGWVSGTR